MLGWVKVNALRRFIIHKIILHELVQIAFASKLISSEFSEEIPPKECE